MMRWWNIIEEKVTCQSIMIGGKVDVGQQQDEAGRRSMVSADMALRLLMWMKERCTFRGRIRRRGWGRVTNCVDVVVRCRIGHLFFFEG